MSNNESVRKRVERCLRRFAISAGHDTPLVDDGTDLAGGLGLTSDEGLDLVLDLCEEFAFDFPRDFNPVVHESGRRGRRFGELVQAVQLLVGRKEVQNGRTA